MGTDEGVIGFFLNLLTVVVPPRHTAFVGAEVLYLPADRLHHDLTTVPAGLAAVEIRMAANMGADRAGWDAHGQGNFGAGLSLVEHLGDGFDFLFFHG